jgi:excisionase family DNA binding protein
MSTYLTAAEVAETLGVSTRSVLRWIDRGDLPAVRLPGGRLRVSQTALAEHLAAWSTTSDLARGYIRGYNPSHNPSEEV